MSANTEPQERAFQFLLEKCNTQELFTRQQFGEATGWSDESFRTYLSKQFRDLLIPVGDKFRVSFAFRRFGTWRKFRDNVVTQNRRLTRAYKPHLHENVVMFEFFMPLRNEEFLRDALDGLFYKDSLRFRLKTLSQADLQKQIPGLSHEKEDPYLDRVCDWLSKKFIGYSISHVTGRFRAGDLKTRQEAAQASISNTRKYLIDETTAVVRFIFPCAPEQDLLGGLKGQEAVQLEASRLRWFFHQLFVGSILEVVSGEDEIWLLETGMINQLHIYSADD
jgi:hypothetical protein